MKIVKSILLILLIVFISIQFIRPEKNLSATNPAPLSAKYAIPDTVNHILQVSCNDCHSNVTTYPWYSEIQPVAWWLSHHVKEGKEHLNFSEFTSRPIAVQNHKLEEIIETVEEGEMPLNTYTLLGLHQEAELTEGEKTILISWAKENMAKLKAEYPADSLILRRPPPRPAKD